VPISDLGLDACWPEFVSYSKAFGLASSGLAPKSAGVVGWQYFSRGWHWHCDSLC
jgi:hypothetical protein